MRKTIVSTMILTLVCPTGLFAADPVGPAPIVRKTERIVLKNVELSADGALRGQLVNKSGHPLANTSVKLQQADQQTQIQTDAHGSFVVSGLRSGQCIFRLNDEVFACRVWKRGTAPPNSLQSLALVASADVVRGQMGIPLPYIPLPSIPLPAIPLPTLPLHGSVLGLGGGSMMGVTLLAVGGGAIAIAASDSDSKSSNASL